MATADRRATAAQRFWAKVDRGEGCWLWRGAVAKSRRGAFWFRGQQVPAHRFAWELEHGQLPAGMKVGQTCGLPLCVRHLYVAPQEEVDRAMRNALKEP